MSKAKPKRTAPSESISDQIREAIRNSGLTYYELETKTNVDHAVLSRFMGGKRSMTLDTLDRLAPVLKLRLVRR